MLPRAGVMGWQGCGCAAAIAIATAGSANAQLASDRFGIERFRLAMDRAGLLDVDWADVPGHLSWGLGLWAGLAHDPLVAYDRAMTSVGAPVHQRLTTGIVGAIALWDRVEAGLGLDVVGYQTGAGPSPVADALP